MKSARFLLSVVASDIFGSTPFFVLVDTYGPHRSIQFAEAHSKALLIPGLVPLHPDGPELRNRRGREAWHLSAEQRLKGSGEVATADPLEVELGDQVLSIVDPGLFDINGSQPGEHRSLEEVAVAHDLMSAALIDGGDWPVLSQGGRLTHGGGLLGHVVNV